MTERKTEILEALHNGPTTVRFKKKNGEVRDMHCTLNEQYLPQPEHDAPHKKPREPNPEVQSVWDLEKKAWRSFRWETVINKTDE
jgi:hypothetical protein